MSSRDLPNRPNPGLNDNFDDRKELAILIGDSGEGGGSEKLERSMEALRLYDSPVMTETLMLGMGGKDETVGTTEEDDDRNALPILLLRLRRAEKDFLRATSKVEDLGMDGKGGSGADGKAGRAVTEQSPQDLVEEAVAVRGLTSGGAECAVLCWEKLGRGAVKALLAASVPATAVVGLDCTLSRAADLASLT